MQGCPDLAFRLVGEVVLKGKEMPVMLYQPLGGSNGERELLSDYRAAYAELTAGAPRAVHAFERLRAKYPQDPLIDFYWRRTQSGNLSTRIVMDEK
jgi:adenylate cyclase